MYAATPEALEEKLVTMEDLREFVITGEAEYTARFGYSGFLVSEGYGAAIFTTASTYDEIQSKQDPFEAVAEFWQRFLCSRFRMLEGESLAAYRHRCEDETA